jgi:hypothetical protein
VEDALRGSPHARVRPLFWERRFAMPGHVLHKSPALAVRDGDWKLLLNPDRSRVELYDVPRDPMELRSLADREPQVVERLAGAAQAWSGALPAGPVDPAAGSNAYRWPR